MNPPSVEPLASVTFTVVLISLRVTVEAAFEPIPRHPDASHDVSEQHGAELLRPHLPQRRVTSSPYWRHEIDAHWTEAPGSKPTTSTTEIPVEHSGLLSQGTGHCARGPVAARPILAAR